MQALGIHFETEEFEGRMSGVMTKVAVQPF